MLRFLLLVKTGSLRIIVEQTDNWANVFTGWVQQNSGTRILNIWTGGLSVASFSIQPRLHRIQTNMEILEYLIFSFICPTNPKTVSTQPSTFPIHILSWALLMKIISSIGLSYYKYIISNCKWIISTSDNSLTLISLLLFLTLPKSSL